MKNGRLLLGLVAISAIGASMTIGRGVEPQYTPRNASGSFEAIAGAAAYLNSLRADPATGMVDPALEQAARQQVHAMSLNKTSAALNLQWEDLGPANYGGRARALLIDQDSSNIIYAGSVSGGLFRSTSGGSSWIPVSPQDGNLAVTSITQTPSGDIYYGTGEWQFISYGGGGAASTPAFIGGGIYKSTDNGKTFSVLPSTVPTSLTTGDDWSAIGDMASDPNDASGNTVYAATPAGLRRTTDGGATWSIVLSGFTRDFTIDVNGNLYVDNGSRLMFSSTGNLGDFTELSSGSGGAGTLPRTTGRRRIAVSPQDPNYVYVVQNNGNQLGGVYRSINAGQTWTQIGQRGQQFDPMCSGSNCQGTYDLLFAVSAKDKNKIWLGGITIWAWENGNWDQVNSTSSTPGNLYYMHSDAHELISDPKNPNIVWASTDGGLFKSSDHGVTWSERNLNFRTIQFYKLGVGEDRSVMGGTQDNGTQILDGSTNFSTYSTRLTINGIMADGGQAQISWLSPKVMFAENQNGDLGRSENNGETFNRFFEGNMTAPGFVPMNGAFSNWIMPYEVHETIDDPNSHDSVIFYAYPASQSLGFGDGSTTTYTDVLDRPYAPANFVASSFKIVSGAVEVTSDASGNLSGDGTGTFNAATGEYTVDFTNPPLAEIVITCNVSYNAGDQVEMTSFIGGLPFDVVLPASVAPNDTLKIQDPVQSFIIVGLNSFDNNGSPLGGIWMTREVHDFGSTPNWIKIAQLANGESPLSLTISGDGDVCYVGTTVGRLYRLSNINAARDDSADIFWGNGPIVEVDMIRSFGRAVTDVTIDPNDNDRVLVTLGNYGGNAYVYYSDNATSTSPTFTSKQGNLPFMPAYCATFDKSNPNTVILGTELGMFATDNITAASVDWTNENNGMPMVPVMDIYQYRTNKLSPSDSTLLEEGDIYIATHGRGFYKTGTLMNSRPVSIEENTLTFDEREELNVYPNPTSANTYVSFDLPRRAEVQVVVRDMNGRQVKTQNLGYMTAGEHKVEVALNGLNAGVYMVSLSSGNTVQTGKVVLQR